MAIRMGVNKDNLKAPEPAPAGIYELRLEGFKPKKSKNGDAINWNPQFKIVNNPKYDGTPVYDIWNQKMDWVLWDAVHALGQELEEDGSLPGIFTGDEKDMNTWQYKGPLLGARCKVELVVEVYNGKPNNKIKAYYCAIDKCAEKHPDKRAHSTNLLGKAS